MFDQIKGFGQKFNSPQMYESRFEETSDLSTHIDKIHIGPGLLEGDFRKF